MACEHSVRIAGGVVRRGPQQVEGQSIEKGVQADGLELAVETRVEQACSRQLVEHRRAHFPNYGSPAARSQLHCSCVLKCGSDPAKDDPGQDRGDNAHQSKNPHHSIARAVCQAARPHSEQKTDGGGTSCQECDCPARVNGGCGAVREQPGAPPTDGPCGGFGMCQSLLCQGGIGRRSELTLRLCTDSRFQILSSKSDHEERCSHEKQGREEGSDWSVPFNAHGRTSAQKLLESARVLAGGDFSVAPRVPAHGRCRPVSPLTEHRARTISA